MSIRKTGAVLGAAAAVLVGGLAFAAPANAASVGNCINSGELCLYYNSGGNGPSLGVNGYWQDYVGLTFINTNTQVKNNAATAHNASSATYRVYYNSNYNCNVACTDIGAGQTPYQFGGGIYNQNASQSWY